MNSPPAVHAQDGARDASLRVRFDQPGDITFAANSIMTCSGAGCSQARTSPSSTLDNNDFEMVFIDEDNGATEIPLFERLFTFNSSASDLALPAGASITWAGLYWQCISDAPGAFPPPSITQRNQVRFHAPDDTGYETVVASAFNATVEPTFTSYQGFAEVTSQVRTGGEGRYWLADVQCSRNASLLYGGWGLVVVYRDETQPLRDLTVFDAWQSYSTTPATITVDGFVTPLSGPVQSRVGVILYDGDRDINDSLTLTSGGQMTQLGDGALNPLDDIGNSTISRLGANVTTRLPNYVNTMGFDADIFELTNALPNGATSATIQGVTVSNNEIIQLGVVTFATDIYAPELQLSKTAADVNGGDVQAGDELEYTIIATNVGGDPATEIVLEDAIPTGTTFVAGSMTVDGVAVSDAAGDDRGEYDAMGDRVVVRLGAGATATVGGRLVENASSTLVFRVEIASGVSAGDSIRNTATATYDGETLMGSTDFTAVSDSDANQPGEQPTDIVITATCGDNIVQSSESCDDGDTMSNDGCSRLCRLEAAITSPSPGAMIDTQLPVIVGTADPGATLVLQVDGAGVGMATADAMGDWSIPLVMPLGSGAHTVLVTATDINMDTSTASVSFTVSAAAAVSIIAPAEGASVSDTTPTISGIADPMSVVVVSIDSAMIGMVTAGADGTWSLDVVMPLSEQAHVVSARATTPMGEVVTDSNTFLVDTSVTVAIITPADGSRTTSTPRVTGNVEPDAAVQILIDGADRGAATVTGGTFEFAVTASLADGMHTIQAVATDRAGNRIADEVTFTVDSALVVTLTRPRGATNDSTPTFEGTGVPGTTVTLSVDGTQLAQPTVAPDGTWSFEPSAPFTDGDHTAVVTGMNAMGGMATDMATFTVDRETMVAITSPMDGEMIATGLPTVTGTGEPGAAVTIEDGNGLTVGTGVVEPDGTFSVTLGTPLREGPNTLTATVTDDAGNTASDSVSVMVDASSTLSITMPASGAVVAEAMPTVSGMAPQGTMVSLTVDGAAAGTATADMTGAWSIPLTAALGDGEHELVASATVGGVPAMVSSTFTVDTMTTVSLLQPGDEGPIGATRPEISGTAEPGASVAVSIDAMPSGTTRADAAGNWTLRPSAPLADGSHDVEVTATDAVGNTAMDDGAFTVDSMLPLLEIRSPGDGSVINASMPTVTGVTEPGLAVSVVVDGATLAAVRADATGTWSVIAPSLADGDHEVLASTTDDAGNRGTDRHRFTVDSDGPMLEVTEPVDGGLLAESGPTASGTADPGVTIEVFVDGVLVDEVTAMPDGTWAVPTTGLDDGEHTLRVVADDGAGNTTTVIRTFTVDTVTNVEILLPEDGGLAGGAMPSIAGSAEPRAIVTVSIDGTDIGMTVAGPDGRWSVSSMDALAVGAHDVRAIATDAAANSAEDTATFTYDPSMLDTDGDGLSDAVECPSMPCRDSDMDGTPDNEDADDDGDGVPTASECTTTPCEDTDTDGTSDHIDADDDGDGILTSDELDDQGEPQDSDLDGIPDHRDADDDGDGVPTMTECPSQPCTDRDDDDTPDYLDLDDDGDGIPTSRERADGEMFGDDVDDDGDPNYLDTESDGDGRSDQEEGIDDVDGDGTPNYLDPMDMLPDAGVGDGGADGGIGDGGPDAGASDGSLGDAGRGADGGEIYDGTGGLTGGACRCGVASHDGSQRGALVLLALLGLVIAARRRKLGPVLALVLGLGMSAPAQAQTGFMANQYRMAETPNDGFAVSGAQGLGHLDFGARLVLDYANESLVFEETLGDASTQSRAILEHALGANLALSLGLFDRVVVYLGLPVGLYSEGQERFGAGPDDSLPGDPYLGVRVRLFGEPDDAFALGLQVAASAPLADAVDPDQLFTGERSIGFFPRLMGEIRAHEMLKITINVGGRFRENSNVLNLEIGQEMTYGLGIAVMPIPEVDILAELYGATQFERFGDRDVSPLELLLGVRTHPVCGFTLGAGAGPGISRGYGAPVVRALFELAYAYEARCNPEPEPEPVPEPEPTDSDGDGLLDEVDGCPSEPEDADGFEDNDGCPDLDNDGDGVPDTSDGAPLDPEDRDAFEDEDGVPDPDNDGDGIPDDRDGAPNDPEDRDGFSDEDGIPDLDNDGDTIPDEDDECPDTPGAPEDNGCPQTVRVDAESGTIVILQRVEFASGRDTILERSFPVLEDVRTVLETSPQLRRIRIEGHTDDRGREERNLELSRRRAQSVLAWLASRGIDRNRLVAYGCGELHPLDSNRSRMGRQVNRRVEFHILEPVPPNGARELSGCSEAY